MGDDGDLARRGRLGVGEDVGADGIAVPVEVDDEAGRRLVLAGDLVAARDEVVGVPVGEALRRQLDGVVARRQVAPGGGVAVHGRVVGRQPPAERIAGQRPLDQRRVGRLARVGVQALDVHALGTGVGGHGEVGRLLGRAPGGRPTVRHLGPDRRDDEGAAVGAALEVEVTGEDAGLAGAQRLGGGVVLARHLDLAVGDEHQARRAAVRLGEGRLLAVRQHVADEVEVAVAARGVEAVAGEQQVGGPDRRRVFEVARDHELERVVGNRLGVGGAAAVALALLRQRRLAGGEQGPRPVVLGDQHLAAVGEDEAERPLRLRRVGQGPRRELEDPPADRAARQRGHPLRDHRGMARGGRCLRPRRRSGRSECRCCQPGHQQRGDAEQPPARRPSLAVAADGPHPPVGPPSAGGPPPLGHACLLPGWGSGPDRTRLWSAANHAERGRRRHPQNGVIAGPTRLGTCRVRVGIGQRRRGYGDRRLVAMRAPALMDEGHDAPGGGAASGQGRAGRHGRVTLGPR
ncbi:MAG: hypothetical protein AVDCRST_MAG49-2697 [uncultured Thermomicrobiales bacterium]|uniref:Uncharacterized protein n=1 Tax=uncultured Thermomicrobiales bacterium TaxID=1645740 RepID=A0A6J4V2C0_9BACT|nr:MAG: hypothetical protein AVDCRST_MAG49-2697 [uncultured Thermomicrobiales bacterium]